MSIISSTYRFITDDMVGKLARFLRLLGFDCFYKSDISNVELIRIALCEQRIILTRDTRIIERVLVKEYLLLKSDDPESQLREVIDHFRLQINPYDILTRCLECNLLLKDIDKEDIKGKVWPYVYQTQNKFKSCPNCNRIYWEGTHVEAMKDRLRKWDLVK